MVNNITVSELCNDSKYIRFCLNICLNKYKISMLFSMVLFAI